MKQRDVWGPELGFLTSLMSRFLGGGGWKFLRILAYSPKRGKDGYQTPNTQICGHPHLVEGAGGGETTPSISPHPRPFIIFFRPPLFPLPFSLPFPLPFPLSWVGEISPCKPIGRWIPNSNTQICRHPHLVGGKKKTTTNPFHLSPTPVLLSFLSATSHPPRARPILQAITHRAHQTGALAPRKRSGHITAFVATSVTVRRGWGCYIDGGGVGSSKT